MFLFNHYRHSSLMNTLIKQNFKQNRKGSSQEVKKKKPPYKKNPSIFTISATVKHGYTFLWQNFKCILLLFGAIE